MNKVLKKSEVLREGYVQGLKKAQSIISKMLKESVNGVEILTPEKTADGMLTGKLVEVDEEIYDACVWTAEAEGMELDGLLYIDSVEDYNEWFGTDYADEDELRSEEDVICVQDGEYGYLVTQ